MAETGRLAEDGARAGHDDDDEAEYTRVNCRGCGATAYDSDDEDEDGRRWVGCDGCRNWMHVDCVLRGLAPVLGARPAPHCWWHQPTARATRDECDRRIQTQEKLHASFSHISAKCGTNKAGGVYWDEVKKKK